MRRPDFSFNSDIMQSLVGGVSAMDLETLSIRNIEQAHSYIRSYGYEVDDEEDQKKIWNYYRRAVTFIQSELLEPGEEIPHLLAKPDQIGDIGHLLIYASTRDSKSGSLRGWACAIVKVIHVLVHLDNDLFYAFSKEIQEQILKPIQSHIYNDPALGTHLGSPSSNESIPLKKFNIKYFKTSDSAITKLLAKPDAVAFTLLDKVGFRFVTKHLYDVFCVMRYLTKHHIISTPHHIPDQCNNTLYPVSIFLEAMESLTRSQEIKPEEVDTFLYERLKEAGKGVKYVRKPNSFSSADYKFVKFITRQLVHVKLGGRSLSFFYPFEVQIVDYENFLKNLSGLSSHDEYKKRQRDCARARILGHITNTS